MKMVEKSYSIVTIYTHAYIVEQGNPILYYELSHMPENVSEDQI